MSLLRLALRLCAAAALTMAGCGSGGQSRALAYKDVQIAELETQVGDLKQELASKEAELAALQSRQATRTDDLSSWNWSPTFLYCMDSTT